MGSRSHPDTSSIILGGGSNTLRLGSAKHRRDGFFLAGGLALIVAGAVDRPTKDIDAFSSNGDVPWAADALELACRERGWGIDRPKTVGTFARIVVETDRGPTMVELAQDSPPLKPLYASFLGH